MINRRHFTSAALGAALLAPDAGSAQTAGKPARIGLLSVAAKTSDMAGSSPRYEPTRAFLKGMQDLGYSFDRDFVTEPRGGEGNSASYAAIARELLRLRLEVIVAAGPALRALHQLSPATPVVMGGGEDPVGQGFVESLARPGGRFTGLSNQTIEITGKKLELLKVVAPGPGATAVLWDPDAEQSWKSALATASIRGWKLMSLPVKTPADIEKTLKAASAARIDGLLVLGGLSARFWKHLHHALEQLLMFSIPRCSR